MPKTRNENVINYNVMMKQVQMLFCT